MEVAEATHCRRASREVGTGAALSMLSPEGIMNMRSDIPFLSAFAKSGYCSQIQTYRWRYRCPKGR
jgi:hypothetical protein